VRPGDLLGRLGGEEFAVVLYDVAAEPALALADQLRGAFEQATKDVDGRPISATLSVGFVYSESPVLDVPQLLAQADQALYFAKERGRNRIEVASLNLVRERLALDGRPALADGAASRPAA
jgi:diguanylate cyclase (GGDEF)-like protein